MKLYEVIPQKLYMRGEFHKLKTRRQVLVNAGIDTVVCLLRRTDPLMPAAVRYHVYPLPDSRTVDQDYVTRIADVVDSDLESGHKVLVHCIAGRNRSGIVCAYLAMRHLNLSGPEAVDHIRSVRPGALTNPYFVSHLEELDRADKR